MHKLQFIRFMINIYVLNKYVINNYTGCSYIYCNKFIIFTHLDISYLINRIACIFEIKLFFCKISKALKNP